MPHIHLLYDTHMLIIGWLPTVLIWVYLRFYRHMPCHTRVFTTLYSLGLLHAVFVKCIHMCWILLWHACQVVTIVHFPSIYFAQDLIVQLSSIDRFVNYRRVKRDSLCKSLIIVFSRLAVWVERFQKKPLHTFAVCVDLSTDSYSYIPILESHLQHISQPTSLFPYLGNLPQTCI